MFTTRIQRSILRQILSQLIDWRCLRLIVSIRLMKTHWTALSESAAWQAGVGGYSVVSNDVWQLLSGRSVTNTVVCMVDWVHPGWMHYAVAQLISAEWWWKLIGPTRPETNDTVQLVKWTSDGQWYKSLAIIPLVHQNNCNPKTLFYSVISILIWVDILHIIWIYYLVTSLLLYSCTRSSILLKTKLLKYSRVLWLPLQCMLDLVYSVFV